MRILVTGGAGFIGSHTVSALLDKGHQVRVLDDLSSGYLHNLKGLEQEFVRGSITDRPVLAEAMQGMQGVIHLAALVSAPESLQRAADYVRVNALGTAMVLEEAAAAGVECMVLASSAAVYGNEPGLPKSERMLPVPETPYASSKLEGEHLFRMMGAANGIRTMCFRFFNVYGPRQDPGSPYSSVISKFSDAAARGDEFVIYGDGSQTRDFVFVGDLAAILAETMESDCSGLCNLATGHSVTVLELAQTIREIKGAAREIVFRDFRAGDVKYSSADVSILNSLGFSAATSLRHGLSITLPEFATGKDSL
ncbi:MAG: dTDP-glucose 4,6-dehydratase [Candidatus Wallbacteria bacterium HGW-Wallbacteria-1]|uniref:dTDP-glucose 4,6-dehydratase n=1 Tax=Candidatus Wallbacteria bacterium HGW-Wallbacteria-1 TaxID=2013854 RepID=A0A2N1PPB1_9BACT|nr:MAG: dTDP-glucose 4,6-dehydratase [Candidatus Wallbacteria bacterium HGW-Wallbacteria-1]